MATSEARPETTLRLERTIAAPLEKVFAAWTTPEALIRWFAPTDAYTVEVHELNAVTGGAYTFELVHSGGNRHRVGGKYREVTRPSRLVFSWKWEEFPERGDTLVTVELTEDAGRTRLVLTHELFPNVEARDGHAGGWNGGLDHLVQVCEAQA